MLFGDVVQMWVGEEEVQPHLRVKLGEELGDEAIQLLHGGGGELLVTYTNLPPPSPDLEGLHQRPPPLHHPRSLLAGHAGRALPGLEAPNPSLAFAVQILHPSS